MTIILSRLAIKWLYKKLLTCKPLVLVVWSYIKEEERYPEEVAAFEPFLIDDRQGSRHG